MNNATVSMTSLLDFIHSMSLSASNKKWLADRLYEETKSETAGIDIYEPTEFLQILTAK